MSIHRWQKEFKEALKYKSCVILCNNVKDRYLYLAPGTTDVYELLSITDCLVRFLKQTFNTIKVYDAVDKITDYSPRKSADASPERDTSQGEFAKTTPRQSPVPQESPVDRDLVAIGNELISSENTCYIFTFADKTLPLRSSSLDEQKLLLRIEKMIQSMKPLNRLILLYPFEDQIPPELYKNNPKTKIVNISSPDRGDLKMMFQDYLKMEKDEIDRAVNISHGLKLLEIEQIITGIGNSDIKKFEEAIRLYKFGEKRDYWQEVTLEKLNKAGKFFLQETTDAGRGGIQGQDTAIRKVIEVLMNAVADIQRRTGGNPSRPKGALFFAGPTGVGKTLTAQKLATFLFGSEDKLIRLDMSEYKDEFQVTRLYGAPPGYVGYESGGTLTTAIKDNPFSVILFDEIEKAHPRIFDIFLQILSDGRLTDSKGETVYFAESIIIFTSNLGTRTKPENEKARLEELRNGLRENEGDLEKAEGIKKQIREHFRDSVENFFAYELSRPELFNRIGKDNVLVFDFISSNDAKKMLENYLIDLQTKFNRYSQNEVPSLTLTMDINEITNQLFQMHKDEISEYGGRHVVHLIDVKIRNKVAIAVLQAKAQRLTTGIVKISLKENGELDVKFA